MMETGLIQDTNSIKADEFWDRFPTLMDKFGYTHDKEDR